jgi:hypothetical protein
VSEGEGVGRHCGLPNTVHSGYTKLITTASVFNNKLDLPYSNFINVYIVFCFVGSIRV